MAWHVPDRLPRGLSLAGRSAVREIGGRDEKHTEALMWALLRAAWPSLLAQNQ